MHNLESLPFGWGASVGHLKYGHHAIGGCGRQAGLLNYIERKERVIFLN